MFRQLANLRSFGRIRTVARTQRANKPRLLRKHPELEVIDFLGMAARQYARPDDQFRFVQIGAFDGRTCDPLQHLVKQHGWQGVLVEPQPGPFHKLKENYAEQNQLQFFNVAIGRENGEMSLFQQAGGDGAVTSVTRQLVVKPGWNRVVEEIRVPCWSFDRLVAESRFEGPIDLLQIDAEGFDFEIIKSIDLRKHRPTILRYEHMILSEADRNACLELLAGHGYRFLLEDGDTTAILVERDRLVGNGSRAAA